ncbi:MAG: ketoacyl-ACP synthase III [Deltaproteobacteria bacterium]|nr:ketoacyl-ACP synthase III [Deltaproteobacteria bacterium]
MIHLHGIGHFHPENVIDNVFLESLDIGTSCEWIMERVGIQTRRTVLPLDYIRQTRNRNLREASEAALYGNAEMAADAARMALDRAGLKPSDIGLVISGSCSPDYTCPAEAASVAAALGIEVPGFDLNSACSSFGMQVTFLDRMKPETLPSFILLVNPESLTRCVDYGDRNSAVLFGDGSAAAVVSASVPARAAFDSCACESNPSAWTKVQIPRQGYFQQDGKAVQGFAIRKSTDSLRLLQSEYSLNGNRLKFVGHQANLGMLATVCERAGIEDRNHWYNVADFGNTGCAGAPSVLSQHWDDLVPGCHVALSLVGAGLTWVHMMLKVREAP